MGKVIESNVLGRLGRGFQTLAHTREIEKTQNNKTDKKAIHIKDYKTPVLAVPNIDQGLKPILYETIRGIYLETIDKINDSYIEGAINYIQQHHKDLDAEINKVDDRINEVWKKCNDSKASLEDFKTVMALYEDLYRKAINLYRNQLCDAPSNAEAIDKYLCKRCGSPSQRYCFGETKSGKYEWGRFCLACHPHHF